MTARGNQEQEKKALDTILGAVIGIIIVLASYAITSFVFTSLGPGGPVGGSGAGTPTADECSTAHAGWSCLDVSDGQCKTATNREDCVAGDKDCQIGLCNAPGQGENIVCCDPAPGVEPPEDTCPEDLLAPICDDSEGIANFCECKDDPDSHSATDDFSCALDTDCVNFPDICEEEDEQRDMLDCLLENSESFDECKLSACSQESGDECAIDGECSGDELCISDTTDTTKTFCAVPRELGGLCVNDHDCETIYKCESSLCASRNGTCDSSLSQSSADAQCGGGSYCIEDECYEGKLDDTCTSHDQCDGSQYCDLDATFNVDCQPLRDCPSAECDYDYQCKAGCNESEGQCNSSSVLACPTE